MLSPYFNTTPIALFVLGIGARPLLQGISKDAFEEVEGMADGAGLPFDALWLLQAHPVIAAQPDVSTLYRAPFCTMFASVGDRAGADDVLVGRNLDWPDDDPPVLIEVAPATGRRFVHLGFTWNVGAFTGMNDAGLVLCAERIESLGAPPIDGAPVEFVLRDLLQTTDTVEAAVAQLQAHPKLRGYHVLVAGAQAPWAAVVEFGTAPVVRQAAKGFLLGADPGSKLVDDASKARYARLVTLLGGEHIIAAGKMKSALADQEPGQSGACATIWNERTRYSVLLEPKTRTLRVAFRDAGGRPGEYTTLRLTAAEERKKGRR
jgi:hypothetical protein